MLIILLLLTLCLYLVTLELASQDCQGKLCYNSTPSPTKDDSTQEIINKLALTLEINHSPVDWRRALIIGIVVGLIFLPCVNINTCVVVMILIFMCVYLSFSWSNWVYWRPIDLHIEDLLTHIRLSCQ